MFDRVIVESELNKPFYKSLGKQVVPIWSIPESLNPTKNDLIVLSGGRDINPMLYGEEPHPYNQCKDLELGPRDKLCVDLWNLAEENKIPVLGICRGAQHIAAMKGIKLIQHLDDVEGGTRNVEFDGVFWAKVPKCHHQAIPVTKQLNVHAVTTQKSTGLSFVEAFSLDNGRVIGVQGHPEWCNNPNDNFPSWIRNKFASYLSS